MHNISQERPEDRMTRLLKPAMRRVPRGNVHHQVRYPAGVSPLVQRFKGYLWLAFAMQAGCGLFRPVSLDDQSTGLGLALVAMSYAAPCALLIDAVFHAELLAPMRAGAGRLFSKSLLACVIVAGVIGLKNHHANESLAWFFRSELYEWIPMLLCGLVYVGAGCGELLATLPRMLLWQSGIAAIYALLILWMYPVHQDRDLFGNPHYVAYGLVSISIIPVTMLDRLSFRARCVACLSYAVFIGFNIIYQSRGGFIMTCIVIPSYIFIAKGLKPSRKTLGAIGLSCATLLLVIASLPSVRSELAGSWTRTMGRLYGGREESSVVKGLEEQTELEYEDSRGAEAKDFLHQLNIQRLAIGEGFGGTWWSEYWGIDWPIVHFGPLHMILKGGVPLLVTFLGLFANAWYASWMRRWQDPLILASNCFIVYLLMCFVKHGPIRFYYETVILWLMIGVPFASRRTQHAY